MRSLLRRLRSAVAASVSILLIGSSFAWPQAEAPAQRAPAAPVARAAAPAATSAPPPETAWPRTLTAGTTTLTIYQPQLDSYDGYKIGARAAVAAKEKDGAQTYGIVHATAHALVDKGNRTVLLDRYEITSVDFPAAEDKAGPWVAALQKDAEGRSRTMSLDRLEALVGAVEAEKKADQAPLKNDPPAIVFSTVPAMLVYVDGDPAWRPVAGTSLERVINTRPLLLRDTSGKLYLHVFDGWMASASLTGPYAVDAKPPAELEKAKKAAIDARQVDLLTGESGPDQKSPPPTLAKGPVPQIHVATSATELVVTDGEPKWVPVQGTELLYVENTTGHIFKEVADQKTYVLVSGRWFRAPDLKGPWEFVAANALPKDFPNIPDDSPKENVKAAVAGTPQAKEAAIAAQVPQTSVVKKSQVKMTPPQYDGEPQLRAIAGTSLQYVVNTATPVIMVDTRDWYAVENGVWFVAHSAKGPWVIATMVPAVIYSIPPSSPLHYVTYVKVYDSTPDTVVVGYTPGYQGSCVDPVTEVVVYGTGYPYTPWIGTYWYGPPVTYGFGVAIRYTPWTGWTFGFGFGWSWGAATVAVGWGWGAYPWWGPYGWGYAWGPPLYGAPYAWGGAAYGWRGGAVAWGPGGWAGHTGNIYSQWGPHSTVSRYGGGYDAWTGNAWRGQVGASYNSRTGVASAGQRGAVGNVYTGNYAAGSRGVAQGPGGATIAGSRGTAGNAYTGGQVSGNRGVAYNPNTGNATSFGGIHGNQGGIGHIGDDVYASHDGNVYKKTDGGWQQRVGGGWQSSNLGANSRLDRESSARSWGEQRANSYRSANQGMNRSFGGARRGGGGFRRR
jgi:hypothetical protein